MPSFSQDISNFQRYGTYTYKFDSVGNLVFDSSSADFSQVYLAIPLANMNYDNVKIQSFYNPAFEEFLPQATSESVSLDAVQEQLVSVQQENVNLKSQLDGLIAQTDANASAADQLATKQVILELRKALGQGRVDSDFSDTFPYTPIRKNVTT